MKPLHMHSEAIAEADEAYAYYAAIRQELGDELDLFLRSAFQAIVRSPAALSPYKKGLFRKFVVKKYPYNIFYKELDDRIWIAAVVHQKRRPDYWAHRTPETP